MKLVSILAAAAAAALAAPAGAATFTYSGEVVLDPSQILGTGEFVAHLPGASFAINPGDEIFGTISFANNGRLTVFEKPDEMFEERVSGNFGGGLSTAYFSFTGLQGDHIGPAEQGLSCSNLCFGSFDDLTPTSFSFSGINFRFLYRGDGPSVFDPQTLYVSDAYASIDGTLSPVPEPATWAMMLFGFGAIGRALRRPGGRRALSAV